MNEKIKEVADKISELLDKTEWTKVDRLQKVLEELVKLEIAAIQGKSDKKAQS